MTTTTDKRASPRLRTLTAVMVSPNGHAHDAQVLDLSLGGARLRLPQDWAPRDGAHLRIFFLQDTDNAITLEGQVTRVAVDHMGVAFDPAQEAQVRELFDAIGAGL
ncbi:MAG TPA: PilZ domain-containing protein [Xanthomonadaceae bacterium]|nr:PilZ domain-containing protein [Xanthomonadaceae bacterium]